MKHLSLVLLAFIGLNVSGTAQYCLTVESAPASAVAGATTYRLYANMEDPTDKFSSWFGNNLATLEINAPEGVYNSGLNLGWNAQGINPAFVSAFPELADDTYGTIGLDGPFSLSGIPAAQEPGLVEDSNQPITPFFLTDGATSLLSNTVTGAAAYVLNTAGNALPDEDLRVLIMQITTTGTISGQVNYQVFPLGVGANDEKYLIPFDGVGDFCGDELVITEGCMQEAACNYNPDANLEPVDPANPNACNLPDECGVCDGEETGPGIPDGACDCDGNVIDECGECGGGNSSCGGCTSPSACNYDAAATISDGSCIFPTPTCECDGMGGITNDADGDGVCDDNEIEGCTDPAACNYDMTATEDDGTCLELDVCGVCGGPGAVYECGCADIPEGDCDCDGNQEDALGVCGGDCTADEDMDMICDDVDDCVGEYDACGICNGPGDIYECGCADIPEGDCDCDGNQEDALGVCGGECTADEDADGICDDVDDCVGALDACGVCNGPGEVYECGCADIPEGDCDCDGNQEDALGVCGGDCAADEDADGICDDVDECVGEYDALGVCNGDCEADTNDNDICDSEEGLGCMDEAACNYDPNATQDNGTCEYPEEFYDCDGCINDADGDGVCDELEVEGCDNPAACNYDETATDDDGSCLIIGEACDDMDSLTVNDIITDLCICVGDSAIFGCTDTLACNYSMDANADDGSCLIIGAACDDMDSLTVNDMVNDSCLCVGDSAIFGCTNSDACNFLEDANADDGSCILPGDDCDDGDDATINDTIDENCDCVGEVDGVQEATGLAFGMFPNPTTGEVTLQIEGFHAGVTMQVMDGAGRVVWSEQNLALQGNMVFDLSKLSTGTYNVMLSDERGISVKRLTIQR